MSSVGVSCFGGFRLGKPLVSLDNHFKPVSLRKTQGARDPVSFGFPSAALCRSYLLDAQKDFLCLHSHMYYIYISAYVYIYILIIYTYTHV